MYGMGMVMVMGMSMGMACMFKYDIYIYIYDVHSFIYVSSMTGRKSLGAQWRLWDGAGAWEPVRAQTQKTFRNPF